MNNKKRKKEKIVISISIGLCCFILLSVMCMQFKVVNQTDVTSIDAMTETELRSELVSWREKYEELSAQYSELLVKINEYKEEYKTDEQVSQLLETELQELQKQLGYTDVTGPGIIITIDEEGVDDRINYEDLLYTINALKSAGAEAISVNDQRIVGTTDIVDIDNLYIKVNGKRIVAPYTIKAIGNQAYLESALIGSGGYIDVLKKANFKIEIERDNKVSIQKSNKDTTLRYIETE
ncbi:MAG: DUF881 domain-containing protein [Clostridia bacterium]|nr:DUF881 domain-containing protein [Clostridia bacterium]